MCSSRDPSIVSKLVGSSQRESGDVGVAIYVVWFDCVKALVFAHLEAGFHYWAESTDLADVKPVLSRPADYPETFRRGREGTRVGPAIFKGAKAHIAHSMKVRGVHRGDQARIRVKPIHVIICTFSRPPTAGKVESCHCQEDFNAGAQVEELPPPVAGAGEPFPGLPDDIPAVPPHPIKEMASKTPKVRAKTVCRCFIEVGSVCGIWRCQQESTGTSGSRHDSQVLP